MLFATSTGLLSEQDRPRGRALAFFAGTLVPIGFLVLVAFTAVGPLLRDVVKNADSVIADIDLALGSLLYCAAGYFALRPPHHRRRAPKGARSIWWDALLGVVLEGRDISSMVLSYGALQHVAVAHVGAGAKAVVAAAVVAIVTLPTWLPIVVRVTIPPRLRHSMERSQRWAEAHQQPVVLGVCLVFGTYLVVRGATGH